MHIAYLSTHYPSVSHTFIQGEIISLEALGHDVLPMALNTSHDSDVLTDLDRSERRRTFYVKEIPHLTMLRILTVTAIRHPVALIRSLFVAARLGGANVGLGAKSILQLAEGLLVWHRCEQEGIRAIHSHFGQAPASVALLAKTFGNFLDADSWTWSMTIHGWHDLANEDTSLLRRKIRAADLVICISDFTRAQLMRLSAPVDWPKINTVRCGVDLDDFPRRASVRPATTEPAIVTTARLSPEKGHVTLIEAIGHLRDGGRPVRAVFIGDGPFRDELLAASIRFGVSDLVEFTGALPPSEVAGRLSDADVFCLPSYAEGLPVSIMEAMAVGVPTVATFVAGTPELVVNGRTGWIVPPSNPRLLADAIGDALSNPDRDAIVDEARHAVERSHDRAANSVELA